MTHHFSCSGREEIEKNIFRSQKGPKRAKKQGGGSTFGSDTMYVGGWVVGQNFWKKSKVF